MIEGLHPKAQPTVRVGTPFWLGVYGLLHQASWQIDTENPCRIVEEVTGLWLHPEPSGLIIVGHDEFVSYIEDDTHDPILNSIIAHRMKPHSVPDTTMVAVSLRLDGVLPDIEEATHAGRERKMNREHIAAMQQVFQKRLVTATASRPSPPSPTTSEELAQKIVKERPVREIMKKLFGN